MVTTYGRVQCHNTSTATCNSSAVTTSKLINLYQFCIINKILRCLTHRLLKENCPASGNKLSSINELLLKPRMKVLLSPVLPEVIMSIALFGGTQALFAFTGKCNVKIRLGTEYWWNDTDRKKWK